MEKVVILLNNGFFLYIDMKIFTYIWQIVPRRTYQNERNDNQRSFRG